MRRVFLVHGWASTPNGTFFPYLRRELEVRGYEVVGVKLPHPLSPEPVSWVKALADAVQTPDLETTLVGHSMGGATVLRYLEQLAGMAKVGKVVLVAPVVEEITGLDEHEEKIAEPWLQHVFQEEQIRASFESMIAFFSDNDRWIPLSSAKTLEKRYFANTVVLHERGHFTVEVGDPTRELPEILSAIIGE